MYAQFTCVLSVMLPSFIYEQSKRDIERINGEIKDIEGKMMEIIESSDNLKDNYCLSVPLRARLSSTR